MSLDAGDRPSRRDPVVEIATGVLGGPAGSHRALPRFWTPLRALLAVSGLAWVIGLLTKWPCARGAWAHDEGAFGRACANEWGWQRLAGLPGQAQAPELPPLPGVVERVLSAAASEVGAGSNAVIAAAFGTALVMVYLLLLAVALLAAAARRRTWDAALMGLAPMLALTWATDWRVLAPVCVAVALWAWGAERPLLAGVAVGAAASTQLVAAAVLLAIVAFALGTGRSRQASLSVLAAVSAWAVLAGVHLLRGGEVGWWVGGVGEGSLWFVAQWATGDDISTRLALASAIVLWLGWAGLVLRWSVRERGTVAQSALLLVAGALVLSPSVPSGASLVLLPLAALALGRWAPVLVWQAAEFVGWLVHQWYLAGLLAPGDGGQPWLLAAAVLVRMLGIVALLLSAALAIENGSVDDDPVEGRGRVADPDIDLLADAGHARA